MPTRSLENFEVLLHPGPRLPPPPSEAVSGMENTLGQRAGSPGQCAGAGPGLCLPVPPQVQGEGVPSGLQDITHTLWVQALSQEKGGVQDEGLWLRPHPTQTWR